jgi:hypothetical protein
MLKAKGFLVGIIYRVSDSELAKRALHTAWQAALGVVLAGIFAAHSTGDVKALVIAAGAAAASALKTSVLAYLEDRRG